VPTLLFGSSASFEDLSDAWTHLTLVFFPEPVLAADWRKWFDVRWLNAAPLTEARTRIPELILPQGTDEAARQWMDYERLCVKDQSAEEAAHVAVEPITAEIKATAADGTSIPTVSTENKLPKVSPVYRKLAQLFEMGHLVSVDKSTRLQPFEVPVKPKWFGLESLKQIGLAKWQVSYHISALTKDELKQLENRRKKTGELLDLFSFSLADGQRWMPKTAEELFRRENSRSDTEAKGILSKLIAGDLDKFMAGRKKSVSEDANRMYRDLFPGGNLSEEALDEIMTALKARFEAATAEQRSFLPQLSFSRVSLSLPEDSEGKAVFRSSLHLLLSIVQYPRKAFINARYFAQGMRAKPLEILKAMNVLDDPFVGKFGQYDVQDMAEAELIEVEAIETSGAEAEEKCQQLFKMLGHKIGGWN
jgi:hypothetical protein